MLDIFCEFGCLLQFHEGSGEDGVQLWEEENTDEDCDADELPPGCFDAVGSSAFISTASPQRKHFEYPLEGDEVMIQSCERTGAAVVLGPATCMPWVVGLPAILVLWDETAEVSVVHLPDIAVSAV